MDDKDSPEEGGEEYETIPVIPLWTIRTTSCQPCSSSVVSSDSSMDDKDGAYQVQPAKPFPPAFRFLYGR
jgi:hypothetical protein